MELNQLWRKLWDDYRAEFKRFGDISPQEYSNLYPNLYIPCFSQLPLHQRNRIYDVLTAKELLALKNKNPEQNEH